MLKEDNILKREREERLRKGEIEYVIFNRNFVLDEGITQDSFTSSPFDGPQTGQGDTTNETEIKQLEDVPARNRLGGKVVRIEA